MYLIDANRNGLFNRIRICGSVEARLSFKNMFSAVFVVPNLNAVQSVCCFEVSDLSLKGTPALYASDELVKFEAKIQYVLSRFNGVFVEYPGTCLAPPTCVYFTILVVVSSCHQQRHLVHLSTLSLKTCIWRRIIDILVILQLLLA